MSVKATDHYPVEHSAAQRRALINAYAILSRHFDQVLVAICMNSEQADDKLSFDPQVFWRGGHMNAYGLAIYASERTFRSRAGASKPK